MAEVQLSSLSKDALLSSQLLDRSILSGFLKRNKLLNFQISETLTFRTPFSSAAAPSNKSNRTRVDRVSLLLSDQCGALSCRIRDTGSSLAHGVVCTRGKRRGHNCPNLKFFFSSIRSKQKSGFSLEALRKIVFSLNLYFETLFFDGKNSNRNSIK